MKTIWSLALVFALLLGFPSHALAHGVLTNFLIDQQSQLQAKAEFSTGEPLQYAQVQVYSPDDPENPVFVGNTDANGEFNVQLDPQKQGEWTVMIGDVKTSDHGDILEVTVDEKGIEVSQRPLTPASPSPMGKSWIVFGFAGFASVLTTRWLTRNRFWSM